MPSNIFLKLYGVILGLLLGSFANVCIHRIPREESIVWPRSKCPGCGALIRWYQNIPLVSYVFLKGKCAHCAQPISLRYPLVELTMGLLFAWVFWCETSWAGLLIGAVLAFVLLVVSLIDWDWQIIPDFFSLGLLVFAVLVSPVNPRLGHDPLHRCLSAGVGVLAGYGGAWLVAQGGKRLFRKEALGGGDVKLLAGVGGLLGWTGVVNTWFLASLLGTLVFVFLKIQKRITWGVYLPFGPFLAAGAWLHWSFPILWRWWLG